MDMTITQQKIVEQNKLQITLLKTFELTSYVIRYHVYKDCWTSVKSEMLKAVVEPKNEEDKFAVTIIKSYCLVGRKKLENLQKFKILSTSL